MKIPDCGSEALLQAVSCSFFSHQLYYVCAVHPDGVETEKCLDFRPDPEAVAKVEELWSPVGYSWYGNELIPNRLCRYTQEEQLKILDTHPFFTGICPNCGHAFTTSPPPHNPWHCPECGWNEDL